MGLRYADQEYRRVQRNENAQVPGLSDNELIKVDS